jgi:hypothetical protein
MTDKTNLNWPIQLAVDLVKPQIEKNLSNYGYLEMLHIQSSVPLNLPQTLDFITNKLNELNNWLVKCNRLVTDSLLDAWNMENDHQKEAEVRRVSSNIMAASDALIYWEQSISKIIPDTKTRPIFNYLFGTTESLMKDLHQLFRDIDFVINHEDIHGAMEIRSPFQKPKNLHKIQILLNEFANEGEKKRMAS